MYPVSERFLEVAAGSHRAVYRALLLTDRQTTVAPVGGTELPILDGDVKFTADQDVKATMDLTVPGDYWDIVQPYSGEIFLQRGVDFGDGTTELVPLGYFRIDDVDQDDAPSGPIRLTGTDRIASMQQNRVLFPYQVPANTTHRTIFERLVNGRVSPTAEINTAGYAMLATVGVPITWLGYDPDRVTVDIPSSVDDSTYEYLAKLADSKDCVLRFDEAGTLVVDLRDRDPNLPPIYEIFPGRTGLLIKASRKSNREGTYNIVSAYGSDPALPTGYQLAYNQDPTSPLRWNGPFGPAPRYFASPLLKTPDAAAAAAATVLSRYTGLPTTVGLWTVPNPALRPLDMISTKVTGLAESHLIDTVTIPLGGNSPVEIVTRTVNANIVPEDATPNPTPAPGDGGQTTFPSIAVAHNIGSTPGQNHFNIGVGFDGSQDSTFASYGSTHHDFSQAEIEAGLSIPGFYELVAGVPTLTSHPGGGRTSTNTSYARVEYREFEQDGKTKMAFDPRKGQHYIRGTSAAMALSVPKPQMVIAQMHDSSDDTAMIYVNDATHVIAKVKGTTVATLDAAYVLGTLTPWGIEIKDGVINFYWGDHVTVRHSEASFTSTSAGQYFKAGAYMQWNLSNGDSTLGAVQMTELEHWHSVSPLSPTPWPMPARPATGGGSTGSGGGTGTSGDTDDGVQAATLLGWGPVIEGDEFDYVGAPSSKWGMYDGPGHDGNGLRSPSAFNVSGGVLTCTGSGRGASSQTLGIGGIRTPVAASNVTLVKADSTATLNITQSNRVYDGGGHRVPKIVIAADNVTVQNFRISGGGNAGVYSTGTGNVIQNNEISNITTGGEGDINGITFFGDGTKILYNRITSLVAGDPGGSHTDGIQTWNTASKRASSDVIIKGNYISGPTTTSDATYIHQGIQAEGKDSTDGGGGGSGTSSNWVIEGNYFATAGNQTLNFLDIHNVTITRNAFDGNASHVIGTGDGTDGITFYGDNIVTGTYGDYGASVTVGDGPGSTDSGSGVPVTGGMSFNNWSDKYVRIEWRVRTYSDDPAGSGNRYHPVLIMWPTSDQWPQGGEFDFFECDCDSGKYEAYLHIPGNDGSAQEYVSKPLDIQNWHNYAFEWSKSGIKGWVDGQQVFTFPGFKQPPGPMQPTFQLDAFFKSNMQAGKFEAKWMRIYAKPT